MFVFLHILSQPGVKALLLKADIDAMAICSTVQDAIQSLEEKQGKVEIKWQPI